MDTTNSIDPSDSLSMQSSLLKIINAKIQQADSKLKDFMLGLINKNQTPGRPSDQKEIWNTSQVDIFDTIENSSLYTTKLLYLRANLTDYNTGKVLYLLNHDDLEVLSLAYVKELIHS